MTALPNTVSLTDLGASRTDRLNRVAEAGLVAQGRVFLLSLEPVRAQLGTRWASREDSVWETIERALVKQLPPPDIFIRINSTTVLAAIASTDAYEGQVRCAEVLRSVLTFFLGRSVDDDIGISRVSGLGVSGLMAEPVDLATPSPPRLHAAGDAAPIPRPPEHWAPPLAGRRLSDVFQSERHGELTVTLEVVPVWRLDQGKISAYALRQTLPVRPEHLTDSDREKVSGHAVTSLIPILEEYRREGGAFALVLPCSFSVLSARRSRLAMFDRCVDVLDIMRRVVILEIEDVGYGVPDGLIGETAAMVRSFVRAQIIGVRDGADAQAAFREAAFHGLAVSGVGSAHKVGTLIRSARLRSPNIMVHDAPRTFTEDWLRQCGATHVTWAPVGVLAPQEAGSGDLVLT